MVSIKNEGRPTGFPSAFILKSGVLSVQIQQRDSLFLKTVINLQEGCSWIVRTMAPPTGARRGIARLFLWPDCQDKAVLPDDDFTILDFDCLCTQIGGKAVFFPVQKHDADDACVMKSSQRDIRNRELALV